MIRATLVAICWLKMDWTKASKTVGVWLTWSP